MKKANALFSITLLVVIAIVFFNCKRKTIVSEAAETPNLPSPSYNYSIVQSSFDANTNATIASRFKNSVGSDLKDDVVTLGRVLFYDKKLSLYNNVSCGSCHKAAAGFADNVVKSIGFNGGKAIRNTPNLVNEVMNSFLFWDGRAFNLNSMVLMPVANHIEMGFEKIDVLPAKLSRVDYYPNLFKKAFGTEEINNDRLNVALAQFVGSLFSASTKYDNGEQQNFSNFTNEENYGRDLFFDSLPCGSCHNVSVFDFNNSQSPYINSTLTDIGLDSVGIDVKIPSLRNVALTAPYMHDGRFSTLDEVINHYANNIIENPKLDGRLQFQGMVHSGMIDVSNGFGMPFKMKIKDKDKKALIAFLNTLTDKNMLTDTKFSDPFTNK